MLPRPPHIPADVKSATGGLCSTETSALQVRVLVHRGCSSLYTLQGSKVLLAEELQRRAVLLVGAAHAVSNVGRPQSRPSPGWPCHRKCAGRFANRTYESRHYPHARPFQRLFCISQTRPPLFAPFATSSHAQPFASDPVTSAVIAIALHSALYI